MEQETIIDWTARRSGARMTVYGKTRDGEFKRVANIEQIAVEMGAVIATAKGGEKYRLAL